MLKNVLHVMEIIEHPIHVFVMIITINQKNIHVMNVISSAQHAHKKEIVMNVLVIFQKIIAMKKEQLKE